MEIYKIIAEKVCPYICHKNYKIVVRRAKMTRKDTFMFIMSDNIKVEVEFWEKAYLVHINGRYRYYEKWKTTISVNGIADNIIDGLKYYK